MILQAIPFMLALYLFFPRLGGPLWGVPQDGLTAATGLSEQMSPGSIANLALNPDIAFRARFDGPPPPRHQLYWRGPVLEDYDGRVWRQRPGGGPPPRIEALAPPLEYEITLEAHHQPWLLALDAPTAVPEGAHLTPALAVLAREPVRQRQRQRFAAALAYRYNAAEGESTRLRLTRLPAANPRTRALAEDWRRADPDPERLVRRALSHFRQEPFVYTLQPPPLGADPVDHFLFSTRRGFCEHYAAAFVVLMRAAGIPARVVTGYQGGERNPLDGYVAVRQSDAHAWAEVWLAGRGWVRVDPTAAVSPARVEAGLAASIPAEIVPAFIHIDAEWVRSMRYHWEAMNNAWNQWVLGYNPQRQRELLSRLGLPDPDWHTLAALMLAAGGGALALVAAWTLHQRPRVDPALRLWRKAQRRLRRRRVRCAPGETPLAFAERLAGENPELGSAVREIASAYCQARYGPSARPENLRALRAAVARLP